MLVSRAQNLHRARQALSAAVNAVLGSSVQQAAEPCSQWQPCGSSGHTQGFASASPASFAAGQQSFGKPQRGGPKPPGRGGKGPPRVGGAGKPPPPRSPPAVQPEPEEDDLDASHLPLPHWLTDVGVAGLGQDHVRRYFVLQEEQVPKEAYREYHMDALLANEGLKHAAGCKGMQDEFEATGWPLLMHREATQQLMDMVQQLPEERRSFLLHGRAGSGKSCTLLTLTAWARANGCLVMYIPSASALTSGGFYHEREEDGMYDTPDAARRVLQSLHDAHADMLQGLTSDSGKRLRDAVEQGLSGGPPAVPVTALIDAERLMRELTEVKVVMAIDDYNALYSYTGYYRHVHDYHREMIPVEQLRAGSAMRVLEARPQPANGIVVAATTRTGAQLGGISDQLRIPHTAPPRAPARPRTVQVHRFVEEEMLAMIDYYRTIGAIPDDVSHESLVTALHLTGGNPQEFRDNFAVLV